jgi:hypothetical protein
MSPVMQPPVASTLAQKLVLAKGEYQTCHILLPDTQEKVAAVMVNDQYYSFFKTVKDRDKALEILRRLYDNSNAAIITQAAQSYALWVLEEGVICLGEGLQADAA